MAEFSLKPILLTFIVVLIGVVFLREIGDSQVETTELSAAVNELITMAETSTSIVNESITMTGATGNTARGPVSDLSFFGNATNSTHDANIILGVDVNITRNGEVTISQDPDKFGDATVTYNISYTVRDTVTGTTANEDITGITLFGNGNVSTSVTGIDVGAEVNFTKGTGVITASPYNFSAQIYNISYPYEGALYVSNTTVHPFLKLLTIFFVLVIFAFVIKAVKDSSDDFNFGFRKE